MKKIKKISVRVSQEVYNSLREDYRLSKKYPILDWEKNIKTFSDYVRAIIAKGMND